jgi:hypothetical protein
MELKEQAGGHDEARFEAAARRVRKTERAKSWELCPEVILVGCFLAWWEGNFTARVVLCFFLLYMFVFVSDSLFRSVDLCLWLSVSHFFLECGRKMVVSWMKTGAIYSTRTTFCRLFVVSVSLCQFVE